MAISAPTATLADPLTGQIFSRGDTIPPRTDVLWRIERGAVRTLTWSVDGTLITLGYWGPGGQLIPDKTGQPFLSGRLVPQICRVVEGCPVLSRIFQGDAVNTTRVSVTGLQKQFEREGMLLRHKRQLVLCCR